MDPFIAIYKRLGSATLNVKWHSDRMVASRYGDSYMQIEYKLCSGSRYGAYKKVWQPEAGGFLEALPGWFGWSALGAVSSWQYLPRWLQAALGAAWLLTSLTALFLSESKLALAPAAVMAGKYKYTNTNTSPVEFKIHLFKPFGKSLTLFWITLDN